ncbi:MAG: zf-HC2 domain-containing protein, partial [Planctomycetaceae bacterium]|nr:zf-HC2 domain-containing protein [Planctomycetaceae bacterium]
MSSHKHITDCLDAFLFDALPAETVREVEQHLEICEPCQAELAQARERYRQLKSLPVAEASADLIRRTEDRILRKERQSERYAWMNWWLARTNWERVWLSVALTFLLLLVPTIYFATLEPSPYDIQVFGQTYWIAGREGSLRVIVINRDTNQPVEEMGIRLELVDEESHKETQLAKFETDAQGTGQPRFVVPNDFGERCRLRVTALRWGH